MTQKAQIRELESKAVSKAVAILLLKRLQPTNIITTQEVEPWHQSEHLPISKGVL